MPSIVMRISSENSVVFLMGPTASGKTELALEMFNHHKSCLISVDSALIYRGMDIGTAKPSAEVLEKYPHELINICEPEEGFSVNTFIALAKKHIDSALAENRLPILVGGTSFYFNALEHGLSELPESTSESREHFNKLLASEGSEKLHLKLQGIDPNSASRIHPNDSQRITRALEVHYLSGQTLSELQGHKSINKLSQSIKKIILMPDRPELHKRIEKRFIRMMNEGFLEEVETLRKNKKLNLDLPSMRCVGYRQAWQHLDGEFDKQTMIDKSIAATRQLCKRQCTWLRNENDALILKKSSVSKVVNFLQKRGV